MILKPYKNNPILKPNQDNWWESKAVFNCGVACANGMFHMLYRAIGEHESYISRLGYATSRDGITFERKKEPIFKPKEEYEKWGCEDPRITPLNDKFYMTYVTLSNSALNVNCSPRTALASTEDFIGFERHGLITPENISDKDVVFFPEKIGGRYVMLHRPSGDQGTMFETKRPSIWIAYSKDLKEWKDHKLIMKPEQRWEMDRIGAGPPPIRLKDGWLLIYHGVESIGKNISIYDGKLSVVKRIYRAGAVILDLDDPSKVIARTEKPILQPEKKYEKEGDVPNTVFPSGAVIFKEKLYVYYGGADTCINLAFADTNSLSL